MAEYFNRDSLIKAICKIGDDSKGSWNTSSIVDFCSISLSLMWKKSFGDIGNVMERLFNVLIAVA